MEEKVSIITPCYNAEEFISQTIESVLAQTYQNWEMLIVDDNSLDNSISILENYVSKDTRIKLFKCKENQGAAHTRNIALKKVTGKYVAFLDSDDLWKPTKLEKQIDFMKEKDAKLSFTSYECMQENGELLQQTRHVSGRVSYQDLLHKNSMGCLTVMFDANYFSDFQMPLIRKRQDYALWLKLLKNTDYAYALEESLAIYRLRENSISSKKIELIKWNWKLFREIEKFSIIKSFYFLSFNIIKKVLNK
ncbi:glycosyltransferase family 2 protein [Aureivirga marina]|uniref:glycosyltransferase family 2 protein n=1 Tax=Aureivirga marina TaxID=1182451 RepID=UPI0018C93E57|nr:glycosyltransferase family 2 protein [Aureivirga marina]